ncbi:hypothetical protein DSO57_1001048 [Entomophthora muscae]|uniref:Uncharacterized protein n=1 Tax=Entomophthora muscae TaxID=34485 RepID=A0ACC2RP14_9FUNG|nr:hypothetical protein DSO57_1001048 [Entomophthora muscae]
MFSLSGFSNQLPGQTSREELATLINSPNQVDTYLDYLLKKKGVTEGQDMTREELDLDILFAQVPPLEKFIKAIDASIDSERHDKMQEILCLMWELQLSCDVSLYHHIIGRLLESGNTQCVFAFIESISRHNDSEGFLTSNWMFRLAINSGDLEIAKQCFAFMFNKGYVRKNATYMEFLKCLGVDKFTVLLNCVNPRQMYLLLQEFSRVESVDDTLNLLSLTTEMGLTLSASCYDVALELLIRRTPKMAMQLFLAMKKNPLTLPTRKTYISLIKGLLISHNHFEGAAAIRERIPYYMLSPKFEQLLDNIQLQAYFKFRTLESASSFFRQLLELKKVDVVSFSIVTSHYIHSKILRGSIMYETLLDQLVSDLDATHVRPNSSLFNMLIKCYLKVNIEKAEWIFQRRLKAGFSPDSYTYSMFIVYFAKVAQDIARGIHWLELQVASGMTPVGKPVGDLLILIKQRQDVASIRKVQNLLQRSNFLPNLDDHIERFVQKVQSGRKHICRPVKSKTVISSRNRTRHETLNPFFAWDEWE